jgi:hypothetical protein
VLQEVCHTEWLDKVIFILRVARFETFNAVKLQTVVVQVDEVVNELVYWHTQATHTTRSNYRPCTTKAAFTPPIDLCIYMSIYTSRMESHRSPLKKLWKIQLKPGFSNVLFFVLQNVPWGKPHLKPPTAITFENLNRKCIYMCIYTDQWAV